MWWNINNTFRTAVEILGWLFGVVGKWFTKTVFFIFPILKKTPHFHWFHMLLTCVKTLVLLFYAAALSFGMFVLAGTSHPRVSVFHTLVLVIFFFFTFLPKSNLKPESCLPSPICLVLCASVLLHCAFLCLFRNWSDCCYSSPPPHSLWPLSICMACVSPC